MKIPLLIAILTLTATSVLALDYCDNARQTRQEYLEKKEDTERKIAELTRRKKTAQADYGRVDSDLNARLTEFDKDITRKYEMIRITVKERQELTEEYKRTIDELRSGQYCSKCNKTKSQIERAERVSFSTHLRNVKATATSAPASVQREAYDEYLRKRNKSLNETTAMEKELDRLEDRMKFLKREAEQKKVDLLVQQNSLQNQIQVEEMERSRITASVGELESRMRNNRCDE